MCQIIINIVYFNIQIKFDLYLPCISTKSEIASCSQLAVGTTGAEPLLAREMISILFPGSALIFEPLFFRRNASIGYVSLFSGRKKEERNLPCKIINPEEVNLVAFKSTRDKEGSATNH